MIETPLIECVPNFSEGRRKDVIDAIVTAIASASVSLLDVSSDVDHHRTVVTFTGSPDAVVEGAFRGAKAAAEWIDLENHVGVHPRIGATDVIPFIPLRNASMADCVALARTLGARMGMEGIPVYLYGDAAVHPNRVHLSDIRRGGYEALKDSIQSDPDRMPDFGQPRLGRAGASAVGARPPLIAFNAYLNTPNVQIAQSIAQTIRASNGGLPFVKALGLLVAGQAQVSMNLTDFRKTGLFSALTAIQIEAAKHGVSVERTEIVGLVPRDALIDCALAALRLPIEARDLVLETRIGAVTDDYRSIPFEIPD